MFAMDRGGVVGNDGETHQGVFDISYLRSLPHITLMSPKDENELRHMLYTGLNLHGPVGLRYPRGNGIGVALDETMTCLPIGKAEILTTGSDVLFVCYGPLVYKALHVAELLRTEYGISATVINARFAKPLDEELLADQLPRYPLVCTVEDHAIQGGFGSAILEFMNERGISTQRPLERFGVGDEYVSHGTQEEQYAMNGYDGASILDWVLRCSPRQLLSAAV